jgi:hypothetical protein
MLGYFCNFRKSPIGQKFAILVTLLVKHSNPNYLPAFRFVSAHAANVMNRFTYIFILRDQLGFN